MRIDIEIIPTTEGPPTFLTLKNELCSLESGFNADNLRFVAPSSSAVIDDLNQSLEDTFCVELAEEQIYVRKVEINNEMDVPDIDVKFATAAVREQALEVVRKFKHTYAISIRVHPEMATFRAWSAVVWALAKATNGWAFLDEHSVLDLERGLYTADQFHDLCSSMAK
jgi:hypothetical protein